MIDKILEYIDPVTVIVLILAILTCISIFFPDDEKPNGGHGE